MGGEQIARPDAGGGKGCRQLDKRRVIDQPTQVGLLICVTNSHDDARWGWFLVTKQSPIQTRLSLILIRLEMSEL